jgi:hypothetical protein
MIRNLIIFLIIAAMISVLTSACQTKKDYAQFENKNEWSHHYAFGSPSWDNFERLHNNPVFKGRKGMEWPVNGFLFDDPVSHNWFLYIGEYTENYVQNPFIKDRNCRILKSSDKGKSWSDLGNLFPEGMICYDSIHIRIPDVMVAYDDHRYHLIFDWRSKNTKWTDMRIGGIGYAVADRPEGPFAVSEKPLKMNTQYVEKPLLNRYWRMYAPMIFKRENDWVIAYMLDALPAWALAVSTAPKPEGPYSDPKIVLNVERKTNYQPLQEFYPAFTHKGYAYFPSTSVANNRNYQAVHRVKIEEMTEPDKYELFSEGAFWHSENVQNEYAGIWGQTFSGFVNDKDSLFVMYPSKDHNNIGTINLAKSYWFKLNRQRGFWLTAHEEKSFSYIRRMIHPDEINTIVNLDGEMHIVWDFNTPIDVQNSWGKFSFEDENADYKEVVINKNSWKVNYFRKGEGITMVDSGKIIGWNRDMNTINIKRVKEKYILRINGRNYWEGELTENSGLIGILLNKHSYLFVNQFKATGKQISGQVSYGYFDALIASGNKEKDWEFKRSSQFIFGKGAVSIQDSAFAKWNFVGKGFELYAPMGPLYGTVNIFLDGVLLGKVLLKQLKEQKSSLIFKSYALQMKSHAVYIESLDGLLPVDCIKVDI